MLWVSKARQDLCGAGGWGSSTPGLPAWLHFIRPAPVPSPHTPARAACWILHSSVLLWLWSVKVWLYSGQGLSLRASNSLSQPITKPQQPCSARKLFSVVFGSVSSGNWSVSTETLSTQLTCRMSDGNKNGYLAGLANAHDWACSGDRLGRRTGKSDPRYTFNADRHRPVIQIYDLDLSVLPRASKIKKQIFCSSSSISFITLHFG